MESDINKSFKETLRIGCTRVTLANGKVSVHGGVPGVKTRLSRGVFFVQISDNSTRYWCLKTPKADTPDQEMNSSSPEELLETAERTGARTYPAIYALMAYLILVTLTIAVSIPFLVKLTLLVASAYASAGLWQVLSARSRAIVLYELSESKSDAFSKLRTALKAFGKESGALRIVETEVGMNADESKRNAGSGAGVLGEKSLIGHSDHPGLNCNIRLPSISGLKLSITFLPDGIIASGESGASFVPYRNMSCRSTKKEWIGSSFSGKAKEIGNTWQYVNKSGEPDKRFKNNKRVPIYEIEMTRFSSKNMPDIFVFSPLRGLGKLITSHASSLGGKQIKERAKKPKKMGKMDRDLIELEQMNKQLQDMLERMDKQNAESESRVFERVEVKDAPTSVPDAPGVYYWIGKKSNDPIYIGLAIGPGGLRTCIVDEQLNPDFLEFDPANQSSEDAFQLAHPVVRADGAKGIDKSEFRRCLGQAYRLPPGNGTVQYIHKNCLLVYYVFDDPEQAREHWENAIEERQPTLNFYF